MDKVYHFSPPYSLPRQRKRGVLRTEGKMLHRTNTPTLRPKWGRALSVNKT
jgi:hypothetical protein